MNQPIYELTWARYGQRGDSSFMTTLKQRMDAHGITQAQLAARAGHDPSQVCRWFKGHRAPDLESKMILDEALDQLIAAQS